jgi:signal transduction histidine kinase/Tfp pilus assembly protein PilF
MLPAGRPVAHAQPERIDSLRAVIAAHPGDTAAVHARVALCVALRMAGDTTYLGLLDSTIAIAADAGMHQARTRALFEKGRLLLARGRTDQAREQFQDGQALAERHGLPREQGEALFFFANMHRMRSEHVTALDLYGRALAIFRELGLERPEAVALSQQGVTLVSLGRFEESARRFHEALTIYDRMGDTEGMGTTLNNLGAMYEKFSRPDEAIGYYRRALDLMRPSRSGKDVATLLSNIGLVHRQLGDMDSCRHYMRAAFAELEAVTHLPDQAFGLMLHGEVLLAMEMPAEAEVSLRRALEIFQQIGARQYMSQTLVGLADAVSALGRRREGIAWADEALAYAQEAGTVHEALTAHKMLARLHEEAGDTGRALLHHKGHIALKDSLVNVETTAALAELRTRYETEKKDRLLADQELLLAQGQVALERRGRSIRLMGLGVAAVTVILLLVVRGRRQRLMAAEREREAATARAVLEGEERERQRTARELHDGIGVLLSNALVHQQNNDGRRAAHLMEEACTEVRHIAHAMMPGSLARFGLVKALEELARNSSLKEGLHVRVQTFGMSRRLPPRTEFALYRIAQEAVNNAIEHARADAITVDLSQEDGRVHLVVTDDGTGTRPAGVGERDGPGHIRARAELLGGSAERHGTPGKGTVWEVRVPLATAAPGRHSRRRPKAIDRHGA